MEVHRDKEDDPIKKELTDKIQNFVTTEQKKFHKRKGRFMGLKKVRDMVEKEFGITIVDDKKSSK